MSNVQIASSPEELQEMKKQLWQTPVDPKLERQCLETALYSITNYSPFLGTLLQCLSIYYSASEVPTLGVMFDVNSKKWTLVINPIYFCKILNVAQREAVMIHEICHITHAHPVRLIMRQGIQKQVFRIYNMAMDMAINQYISDLPKGCSHCPPIADMDNGATCMNALCPGHGIFVEDYYDEKDGVKTPWPTNQAFEIYYEKLLQKLTDQVECPSCGGSGEVDDSPNSNGAGNTPGANPGDGPQSGDSGEGSGEGDSGTSESQCASSGSGNAGNKFSPHQSTQKAGQKPQAHDHSGKSPCPTCSGKGKVQVIKGRDTLDSHQWDATSEEKDMLDATEEIVQRAMIKRSMSYDNLPGNIKELLDLIKARRKQLDYKGLLLSAIKKHASGLDKKRTWTKPSRRYGNMAPGSKVGDMPKVDIYIDSSGSISVEELNEFLSVVDEFLKVGNRKCMIGLWHTDLYSFKGYRMGDRLKKMSLESGGTDPECVIDKAVERRADLAIVITDGCYGDVAWEKKVRNKSDIPQTIWVISKDGSENHPLKDMSNSVTVKIPKA